MTYYYVSRMIGRNEFALCCFGVNHFEFVNVEDEATIDGFRIETTDRDEAQEYCDAHCEWDGSVECFVH